MKASVLFMSLVILIVVGPGGIIQTDAASPASKDKISQETKPGTRTIIADLLMVDGDFYVVRGERGEIRIEATPTTDVTEEFQYGDRIKAVVLPNDKALSIQRASAGDVPGVYGEKKPTVPTPVAKKPSATTAKAAASSKSVVDKPSAAPVRVPTRRTIIADLLMVDGDFYVVRGERGEIRIEATPTTDVTEEFQYGDRIKAVVLPNDKALSIQRAATGDMPGVSQQQDTP